MDAKEMTETDKMTYNAFICDSLITDGKPYESAPNQVVDTNTMLLKRNQDGLVDGLEYKYKNGRIDWQAMFNPEYLVYPDNDRSKTPLLKVDGLLDLAEVRGIEWKQAEVQGVSDTMVIVKVKIKFIPNVEDPVGRIWEGVADATPSNVGGKAYSKYLSAIAETRAVGRCIRGALGIKLCTVEEISKDDLQINDSRKIPDETLTAIRYQMKIKGVSEETIMKKVHEKYDNINGLGELNAEQGRKFLTWLNEMQNSKS